MNKEELIKYEAPSISEWISFEWGQKIIAKYISWKINRKLRRYNKRVKIEQFLKTLAINQSPIGDK